MTNTTIRTIDDIRAGIAAELAADKVRERHERHEARTQLTPWLIAGAVAAYLGAVYVISLADALGWLG